LDSGLGPDRWGSMRGCPAKAVQWAQRSRGRKAGRGDVDNSLPKPMELEEEFDFTGAVERIDGMQGGFAARALEWIGAPNPEDEVSPNRAHRSGRDFLGWCL
jgi:hypothetical protein